MSKDVRYVENDQKLPVSTLFLILRQKSKEKLDHSFLHWNLDSYCIDIKHNKSF